ncbi:hypothetical protein V6N11_045381 [Hibiscus sabdariffa]|uniref:Uncharacterized protein n=1 Tax=Hibiscus sabdariffa TaxID=183260 RepID=A0ABR2Q0T0_9ROSI
MANNLFAAIDMGTNALKLLIVEAHLPGKFIPLLTVKEPVILGHDSPLPPSPPIPWCRAMCSSEKCWLNLKHRHPVQTNHENRSCRLENCLLGQMPETNLGTLWGSLLTGKLVNMVQISGLPF